MSVVEGVIQPGEASRAALKFCRRQNGINWLLYGWLAGLFLIAFAAGVAIDFAAAPLGWPHGLDGATAGVTFLVSWVLLRPYYVRLAIKRFRRRRATLGLPDQLSIRVYAADDAFHYDCAGSSSQIAWAVITEMLPVDGYWVVSANSSPNYVPRRFFADPSAERVFVEQMLQRMTAQARARSKAALAFCQAA